jgi:hypothetical protein
MEKQSLLSLFSSNPDKYYKVSLFDEKDSKDRIASYAENSFGL